MQERAGRHVSHDLRIPTVEPQPKSAVGGGERKVGFMAVMPILRRGKEGLDGRSRELAQAFQAIFNQGCFGLPLGGG